MFRIDPLEALEVIQPPLKAYQVRLDVFVQMSVSPVTEVLPE